MKMMAGKVAMVVLLVAFVGCGKSDDKKDSKKSTKGKAVAKIVNTKCPMMGDDIDDTITVAYKDDKVAFCCEKCVGMWEKLSDEEKAEKLASPSKDDHEHGDHEHGKKGHDHDKDGHDHDKDGHDHDKKENDHDKDGHDHDKKDHKEKKKG